MSFLASSLLVFTWNTLPSSLINMIGLVLFFTCNSFRMAPLNLNRIIMMLLFIAFGVQVLTSSLVMSNSFGSGFVWLIVSGILFLVNLDEKNCKQSMLGAISTITILSLMDAYLRLSRLLSDSWLHIHSYKFGYIGVDTNYTGALLVVIYVLVMVSGEKFFSGAKRIALLLAIAILILLTFSRSAWLVTIILTAYFYTKQNRLLQIMVSTAVAIAVFVVVIGNETVKTKLNILQLVWDDLDSWSMASLIIGRGGNVNLEGISLHLQSLQILYHTGFLGITTWIIILFCLIKLRTFYTAAALALLGLSFVPLSSPVISLCIFLEYSLTRNSRENK